jgi:hypothetical protein
MAIHPFTSHQSTRKFTMRWLLLMTLFGLVFSMTASACGEKEESENTDEVEKVEKKSDSAQAKEDKKEKAEETKKERKKERADKMRELKEKRLNKAKVSADARKKAINAAATAQSGRPEKAATATATTATKSTSASASAKRVVRPTVVAKPDIIPLNIDRILTVSDVKEVTGQKRLTSVGPLPGIPLSEQYNSRYMAPPKRSTFGSSVQVWKETLMRDMNERYSRMRRDYPNVTDTNAITPKGFFSYWNDVMTLVFMDFQKKLLVAVSCSTDICTPEQLYKLAQRAKSQL